MVDLFSKLLSSSFTKDEENCYRQFYLKADLNIAKKGLLLITIPLAAFAFNDYQFLKLSSEFFGLLALRLSLLIFSVLVVIRISRIGHYRLYDKTVTLSALILLLGCGVINATRPQEFVAQVALTITSIFILYLVIPNRFLYQSLLATVAMVGETTIVILFLKPSNVPTLYTLVFSLALTNVIGALTAWQLQSYRKKSFRDFVKNRELQNTLEENTKHLEALVEERSQKLKNSERLVAIGTTAGMVGHDIRNPLQAITSDVYLLKLELDSMHEGERKEGIKESLESIQTNIDYVNKIVQDLQDFARPLVPNAHEVELEKLCQEVLAEKAIPENIAAFCQVQPEAKNIVTDPALLKRILSNLVNNAVQAMPNGGELGIRAYRESGDTVINVRDNGTGIPEEVKPKLFTPLFTTKPKGQGFGLAVVKRMTEALGGTVTFESQEGKGTTFILRLPYPKAQLHTEPKMT